MTRLLFLNPDSGHRFEMPNGKSADPFAFHPPLHLAYLAAKLRLAGHEAFIEDFGLMMPDREQVLDIFNRIQPDIVGLTCYSITYKNAIKLAKLVRQLLPKALILMGGQHVSFVIPETLEEESAIDIIVRLEGEETILEIVDCFEGDGDYSEVAGIGFRKDGKVVVNKPRALPQNLDEVVPMPAWDVLRIKEYHDPGTLITSRGCVGACIFCVANAIYKTSTRHHSAARVIAEIETLDKLVGPLSMLHFVDDDFLHDRVKVMAVCDYLIQRGTPFKWACSARVDAIDEELTRAISKAGCRRIEMGVETGSKTVLARLGKKIELDQVEAAVRWAVESGINVAASFILGHPQDTLDTVSETIVFARHIRQLSNGDGRGIVFTPFSILTPYPGTPIERSAEKLGLVIHSNDYSRYTAQQAVMSTKNLPAAKLNAIHTYAMREFNKSVPGTFKSWATPKPAKTPPPPPPSAPSSNFIPLNVVS
jgi:anaerobic magnesium-protoporphyrin IX monomethyl ester cyclase